MSKNWVSNKLWRLVKVLYFLLSSGIILIYLIVSFWESWQFTIKKTFWPEIRKDYYRIFNYYEYIFYLLVIFGSYVILTDILARISSYIWKGVLKWFMPYKTIFIKFWYYLVIYAIILFSFYSLSMHKKETAEAYCSEKWAVLLEDRTCQCKRWYNMINKRCESDEHWKLYDAIHEELQKYIKISHNDRVLELGILDWEMVDENYGIGLAIKIDKITKWPEEDLSWESYDNGCYEEVEWLSSLTGVWYVFTFTNENWTINIVSSKKIPSFVEYIEVLFTYPIFNTKENNYRRYWWEKPISESDGNRLERTKIINFRDIDWDWEALEFFLINHYDLMCWLDNYRIIWFDKEKKTPILYDFADNKWILKGWTQLSWGSENSFTGWKIKQERICWSNVAWWYDESWEYVFNPQKKVFETKNYKSRKCREDEF